MRPLGEFLADQGYSVLGIRLAGHGTRIEDMNRVTWGDWSNSVLDGWHLLEPNTKRIFLIGLSMGGVLALYHASFLPAKGVVSLATPYQVGTDLERRIFPLYSLFMPYVSKGGSDWQNPGADEEHFSYDVYPSKGVAALLELLQVMRSSLPKITIPALLMHSSKDGSVPPENADAIAQKLGTQQDQVTKILLKNSGHVVTRDLDQALVFKSVHQFIQNVLEPIP